MREFATNFTFMLVVALTAAGPLHAQGTEVEIFPSKDNTLYENSSGSLTNGAGEALFFGQTNGSLIRRALLAFDVAGNVPAGAAIETAVLRVTVTRTISGSQNATAHQVQRDWGEGTTNAGGEEGAGAASSANSATWVHAFFDGQNWDSPGGDYEPGTLTSAQVAGGAAEFPSTAAFVAAVQSWLDSPGDNFGLILIGNESSSATAKRIGSREGSEANRPRLVVTYSVPTSAEGVELPSFLTSMSLYPNPASGAARLIFELSDSRDVRVDVMDVTGRLVATPVAGFFAAGRHDAHIDTRTASPGLYLVRLLSGGQSASRTIVVQ